ncbi:hypothetical protein J3459_014647 [Metarhizium acridum]|uniref:uncharacterized protein n=1 Tax=Metarhizium acridum TaxID=92637 RepID=UPI001C6B7147|nr:hypothetical protein J3458_014485 [Metarhizium acridum]KAG8414545.1 hypothetical protein J3459_014647 [Metarhizium acridum]
MLQASVRFDHFGHVSKTCTCSILLDHDIVETTNVRPKPCFPKSTPPAGSVTQIGQPVSEGNPLRPRKPQAALQRALVLSHNAPPVLADAVFKLEDPIVAVEEPPAHAPHPQEARVGNHKDQPLRPLVQVLETQAAALDHRRPRVCVPRRRRRRLVRPHGVQVRKGNLRPAGLQPGERRAHVAPVRGVFYETVHVRRGDLSSWLKRFWTHPASRRWLQTRPPLLLASRAPGRRSASCGSWG